MASVYASPYIPSLDGDDVFVEESVENAERPAALRECLLTIRQNGRHTVVRLGPNAARDLAAALLECFKLAPGAVTL